MDVIMPVQDQIDTSSRMGCFLYHVIGTVAKLERDLISGHRSHRSRHRECAASLPHRSRKCGRRRITAMWKRSHVSIWC